MSTETQVPLEIEHARACDDYTAAMRECRQLEERLWHAKGRRGELGRRVSELSRLLDQAGGVDNE
jgi:hypothetical protein